MKKVFLISLLLMIGCVTSEQVRDNLQSWNNVPIDTFVMRNGAPTGSWKLNNGDYIYEFSTQRTVKTGGIPYRTKVRTSHSGSVYGDVYGNYSGTSVKKVWTTTPIGYKQKDCKVTLTTSPTGIIKYVSYQGNDCSKFSSY